MGAVLKGLVGLGLCKNMSETTVSDDSFGLWRTALKELPTLNETRMFSLDGHPSGAEPVVARHVLV